MGDQDRVAEVGVAGADVLHRGVVGQMPGALTPRPARALRRLRWMNAIAPSKSLGNGPAKSSESRRDTRGRCIYPEGSKSTRETTPHYNDHLTPRFAGLG